MIRIKGLRYAQRELNRTMKDVVVESEEFVTVALMAISANTLPYVPVDTSALINSERREVFRKGDKLVGRIEFGGVGTGARGTPVQEYAGYVHDGPQKNWQKPGASNRFLAKGVNNFRRDDLAGLIARYSST